MLWLVGGSGWDTRAKSHVHLNVVDHNKGGKKESCHSDQPCHRRAPVHRGGCSEPACGGCRGSRKV